MDFQFDKIVNRENTDCVKYDLRSLHGMGDDVLPLWVADMDFECAPAVKRRLESIVRHNVYGYTFSPDSYYEAVMGWYERHFSFKSRKEWIITSPGIVYALAMAVNAYTKPGDGVLIQRPVYHPFSHVITKNERKIVNSPLRYENGHYGIDFEDFERCAAREDVKLFLLCSPHNPAGRVWTKEELVKMEEICLANGVIVVSDEIHSDFVWEGRTHHVLLSLDEEYSKNVIVCTAPSKSFNIAGLQCSNLFIPDEELRKKFEAQNAKCFTPELNVMGQAACQAAYEEGEEWLEAVKAYIWENLLFMEDHIRRNIPQIKMVHPEGTYLAWLDFNGLGLSDEERKDLIEKKAKLWLNDGAMFGPEGKGFERVNAACPRVILQEAMDRLTKALESL